MASIEDGFSPNAGDNFPRPPQTPTKAELSLTVEQLFQLFGPELTVSRSIQGDGCTVAYTFKKDKAGRDELLGIGVEVPTISPKIGGAFVLTAFPSRALQEQALQMLEDACARNIPAQDLLADLEVMMSAEKILWRAPLDESERCLPDLEPMTPELRDFSSFLRAEKAPINSFVTTRLVNHCYEKMRVEISRDGEGLNIIMTSQPIGGQEEELYRRSLKPQERTISQEEATELLVTCTSELQHAFHCVGPNGIVGPISDCLRKLQQAFVGEPMGPSALPWEGTINPQKSAFIHSYRSGAKLMVEMSQDEMLCELSSRSQEPHSRVVLRFVRGDLGDSEWLERQGEAIYHIKRLASDSGVNQIHALEALKKLEPEVLHKVAPLTSLVGSRGVAGIKEALLRAGSSCSAQIALRPQDVRILCDGIETVKVSLDYRAAFQTEVALYNEMIVELYPDESMAITVLNRLGNQLYLRLSAESVKESGGTSEVFITAVESLHAQAKESSRVLFDRALRELIRDSDTDYIIGQWQGGSADLPDVENDGAVGSHHHAAAVAQWVIERAQNMAMCKVSTVGDEFAKVQVVFPHAPYALEATLEVNTLRQISFYPTAACLDESQRKKGTSYTFTSDLELFGAKGNNWDIFRDFLLYATEYTDPQGNPQRLEDTAMFKGLVGGAL